MMLKKIKAGGGLAWYVLSVVAILTVFGSCIFLLPQKNYSEQENRYLTTMPSLSLDGILSGEVQTELTGAVNDQFPGRELWMQLATTAQYLLYHREINGIYIGEDGYLFEKKLDSDLSQDNFRKNIGYITAMRENAKAQVSVMLVPGAATILTDKLPKRAVTYDASAYEALAEQLCEADSVRFITLREDLQRVAHQGSPQLYFKTDHHWTTNGAYIGAAAYLQANGISICSQDGFGIEEQSSDFYGTLYSKVAGLPNAKADTLTLPMSLPENITIETSGAPADALSADGTHAMPELTGIYDMSKLTVKDKYAVYFGGNYGSLTITNQDAATDRTLLLIKDSYANSLVPYLIESYAQITMLDMRYNNESISQLAAQDWDEILVCYEMSNFIEDKNLFKLLR